MVELDSVSCGLVVVVILLLITMINCVHLCHRCHQGVGGMAFLFSTVSGKSFSFVFPARGKFGRSGVLRGSLGQVGLFLRRAERRRVSQRGCCRRVLGTISANVLIISNRSGVLRRGRTTLELLSASILARVGRMGKGLGSRRLTGRRARTVLGSGRIHVVTLDSIDRRLDGRRISS